MSWLIKYYPVEPAQELVVYNLDVLDCDDYCSKSYQEEVEAIKTGYDVARDRYLRNHITPGKMVPWNNCWLMISDKKFVGDAVNEFWDNLYIRVERKEAEDE